MSSQNPSGTSKASIGSHMRVRGNPRELRGDPLRIGRPVHQDEARQSDAYVEEEREARDPRVCRARHIRCLLPSSGARYAPIPSTDMF